MRLPSTVARRTESDLQMLYFTRSILSVRRCLAISTILHSSHLARPLRQLSFADQQRHESGTVQTAPMGASTSGQQLSMPVQASLRRKFQMRPCYHSVYPPSMMQLLPVMKPEPSPARYTASAFRSSTLPSLFCGV